MCVHFCQHANRFHLVVPVETIWHSFFHFIEDILPYAVTVVYPLWRYSKHIIRAYRSHRCLKFHQTHDAHFLRPRYE